MMEQAFAIKDALLARLTADALPGSGTPIAGVDVVDSWPAKGLVDKTTILVLDFDGAEEGATMRAGGGTRDDRFTLEVVCAAVKNKTADPKPARDAAQAMQAHVKRIVRQSSAPGPGVFGIAGVRMPAVRDYKVREFIVSTGRECDITLNLSFIGRIIASA